MIGESIPQAVWSGSFRLFGVDLQCHVLDNGKRVIDEGSVVALLEAMSKPGSELDNPSLAEFQRWMAGKG